MLKNLHSDRRFVLFGVGFLSGLRRALDHVMSVAKRLEDLIIWQLACTLRDDIWIAVDNGKASKDWNFRDQIRNSSRSTAANISEGFGYFKPRQFAKFLRIARGSAFETRNHVLEGGKKRYFDGDQVHHFYRLSVRITSGTTSLIEYLDGCDPDMDFRPRNDDT